MRVRLPLKPKMEVQEPEKTFLCIDEKREERIYNGMSVLAFK